jgi:hypothetical protein
MTPEVQHGGMRQLGYPGILIVQAEPKERSECKAPNSSDERVAVNCSRFVLMQDLRRHMALLQRMQV